ncbi:hypothetical protein MRQ86_05020 [Streptomyces sp. MMS21 TC-5]|nr:hypothetical protein [Streptomyces sp. MMS21 TC-5]MCI4079709.1 hypothetical protein [Streptomyces sp. MMS21 TC-5]
MKGAKGMKGITFRAWQGGHYVTLAELLVRLGSFGLGLTWRVEVDEVVDPRVPEMERRSEGVGMDTLTLLSLTTPFLQLIDAEARGFAEDGLAVVLTEVDGSLWDVRAADEHVLDELRSHYPVIGEPQEALPPRGVTFGSCPGGHLSQPQFCSCWSRSASPSIRSEPAGMRMYMSRAISLAVP